MTYRNFYQHIFIAFALGILGIFTYIQHDAWFKDHIKNKIITELGRSYNCISTAQVTTFDLWQGICELTDVTLQPKGHTDWQIAAKKCTVHVSMSSLILYGLVDSEIEITNLAIQSSIQGSSVALYEFIKQNFNSTSALEHALRKLHIHNGSINITDVAGTPLFSGTWSSLSHKTTAGMHTNISLSNSTLHYGEKNIWHALQANIAIDSYASKPTFVTFAGQARTPYLDAQQQSFFSGTLNNQIIEFSARTADNNVVLDAVRINCADNFTFCISGDAPTHSYQTVIPWSVSEIVRGKTTFSLQGTPDFTKAHGQITSEILTSPYLFVPAENVHITWEKNNDTYQGTFASELLTLEGSWTNDKQGFTAHGTNEKKVFIPHAEWFIKEHNLHTQWHKQENMPLQTEWDITAHHAHTQDFHQLKATATCLYDTITVDGSFDAYTFSTTYDLKQPSHLKNMCIYDPHGARIAEGNTPANSSVLRLCIQNIFITALCKHMGYPFQADGELEIEAHAATRYTTLNFCLKKGATVQIPHFYNFITASSGTVTLDVLNKMIFLSNFHCTWSKGLIACKRAYAQFDENHAMIGVNIPLTIENFLLHWKKDFFGMISGNAVYSSSPEKPPLLWANIVVEQSHLASHVFDQNSSHGAPSLPDTSPSCDITIHTKQPLHIKTENLETQAACNISIKNTLNAPTIAGSISLLSGTVPFPYKDLVISQGTIYLLPGQKPIIDLTASANIKKYMISLHVTGDVNKPQIQVDSSPYLSEEQIFGLLVVGCETEPLSSLMPALIVNNIKQSLLGIVPEQANASLLKPLSYVHIIPTLRTENNELNGLISLDIGEKWHALIQKNFTLLDQPSIQIEYAFSDDIRMKGTRSEHGDIRADLEMRWRFG